MRETLRLVLVLGLVGMISGGVLGLFYDYTMPMVQARQVREVMEKGLKGVIPEAATFRVAESKGKEKPEGIAEVYEGLDNNGKVLGVAFEAGAQGFGGPIGLVIGLNPATQQLLGVKVMSHAETPGLGAKVQEEGFLQQFRGKPILDPFVVKQDVDGVTGATVSSTAVSSSVGREARKVLQYLGQEVAALPEVTVPAQPSTRETGAEPAEVNLVELARVVLLGADNCRVKELEIEGVPGFTQGDRVCEVRGEKGDLLGLVLVVTGNGFGGPLRVAIGIDAGMSAITGIRLLEHQETPGLGARVAEEEFRGQFTGKHINDSFSVGQDLDGITGATVSSKAVSELVREKSRAAVEYFRGRPGSN